MLRAGMFDPGELDTLGVCLKGVGIGLALVFGGIYLSSFHEAKKDSLVSRVEQMADLDGNGSLCNFEKLRVYEAIGKNPSLYIRSLSNRELKAYLSRVEYRDTENQRDYLKGDARENE